MLLKLKWYSRNILNLGIACVRILFYCLFHPRKVGKLGFLLFSTVNEFYQFSHGRLYNFEKSNLFAALKEKQVFAQCNFFNSDPQVARPVETQILSTITAYLKPKTVFEIGTYNGFTAMHFACNTPEASKIYTLDLPPDYTVDQRNKDALGKYSYDDILVVELSQENINKRMYKGKPFAGKIVELFGDSMHFDFSPYYGKIDLVFIDGSHAYPYVQSDTEQALKMLTPGGIIIWHDFDYIVHRDVFKYLNRLVEKYKIYSIPNTRFAIYGGPDL